MKFLRSMMPSFRSMFLGSGLLLGLPACSCLSGPYYVSASSEMVFVGRAKGHAAIPVYDLRFRVVEHTDKMLVGVSAEGWQVEGFGLGEDENGNLIIDSVGGMRSGKSASKEMFIGKRAGSSPPVFYLDNMGTANRVR